MKGEAATRVDVDPLVFQSYKAVTVLFTSAIFIWVNNILADSCSNSSFETCYIKWTFYDFTPWAFVSAILWVPGGTAGVYAIRRAGLAVSNGIWSCVIVILSFIWGVFIFREKQKSTFGAVVSVALLCVGLCGISYFSSKEDVVKKNGSAREQHENKNTALGDSLELAGETTPLWREGDNDNVSLDLRHFPHSGVPPHCHQTIDLHLPALPETPNERVYHVTKYHLGLCMAVANGVLASTMMVPLHYAPPNSTHGMGYSMSLGIAAVLMVFLFCILRFMCLSLGNFICHSSWQNAGSDRRGPNMTLQLLQQMATESLCEGYRQLPSFHIRVMWKAGLTSGVLYSLGNLFGIVSIQKLGNFMGYSLNQSSMIISGEQPEITLNQMK
ncbi:hypothetical protein ACHAW5_004428 [Stephanodiscus triporus]|uniref:Uncharacterized protein n=1 Tax=Stephanodiscus triporus TaxID=2934178 RepID=A0ABD3Q9A2_9STRA